MFLFSLYPNILLLIVICPKTQISISKCRQNGQEVGAFLGWQRGFQQGIVFKFLIHWVGKYKKEQQR
ncbi:CLUMA_CG006394, isoform A [Clunio marinus]|uniref:CLUMA_CG006394, isoform A n=1 Tax=Clunio marinus TaxID=568069 RepID=A0A1J1I2U3_9DIPT|nr:CLUMA_CG006394, isoform A [Clunio marinus]